MLVGAIGGALIGYAALTAETATHEPLVAQDPPKTASSLDAATAATVTPETVELNLDPKRKHKRKKKKKNKRPKVIHPKRGQQVTERCLKVGNQLCNNSNTTVL